MIIDCHVHIAAAVEGHGRMSARLLKSVPFRFMAWKFGFGGATADSEACLRRVLFETLDGTPELDAAAVLAFDAVYDIDGRCDVENTHLYVTNNYVIELAKAHPKVLFGTSVHPYRKDAVAEIERCVKAGAVLMKWLPMVQNFDPLHPKCIPFYEALAHHRLPLLSHTGAENSLPVLKRETADPRLLEPALARGVTVIAAHCGTRLFPWETDYIPQWSAMARRHEHFYGDLSAVNQIGRFAIYDKVLRHADLRAKVVHGSDWPILPFAPPHLLGLHTAASLMRQRNWLRRDLLIKRALGLGDDYFHRAAKILRTP